VAAALAGKPCLYQRRNVLGDPAGRERPPVDEHYDRRSSGFEDSLDQFLLHARQVQAGYVVSLAISGPSLPAMALTDNYDGNIRFLRGPNGFGKPALVGARDLATAGVRDFSLR
jgi:hypothetical protein